MHQEAWALGHKPALPHGYDSFALSAGQSSQTWTEPLVVPQALCSVLEKLSFPQGL